MMLDPHRGGGLSASRILCGGRASPDFARPLATVTLHCGESGRFQARPNRARLATSIRRTPAADNGGMMSEVDLSEPQNVTRTREAPGPGVLGSSGPMQVVFDRHELRELFAVYGRKVAEGEWRDYSLDFLWDKAVFCVYRRTNEFPLYRIEKTPKLARRQGAYAVIAASGLIMKRGHELARVLNVLEKPLRLVAG
jgi:hypothetical protein